MVRPLHGVSDRPTGPPSRVPQHGLCPPEGIGDPDRRGVAASAYAILGVVLLGVLLATTYGKPSRQYLESNLRHLELALLVALALYAATRYKRRVPVALVATAIGLLVLDLIDFWVYSFPAGVLVAGISLYLRYFLLAYFVYLVPFSERDMRALLRILAVFLLVLTVLVAIQFATGRWLAWFMQDNAVVFRASLRRASGVFPYPNEMALFAGAWFFLYFSRRRLSRLYWLVSVALAADIFMSVTRWFALVLVALVVLYGLRTRHGLLKTVMIGGLAVLLLVQLSGTAGRLFEDMPTYTSGSSPRQFYLRAAWKVFKLNPITGIGFDRFGTTLPSAYYNPESLLRSHFGMSTTDSMLARLLPEFGVLGVALIFGFLAIVFTRGVAWESREPVARGYVYCMLFVALSAVSSPEAFFGPHAMPFWIAVGLILKEAAQCEPLTQQAGALPARALTKSPTLGAGPS